MQEYFFHYKKFFLWRKIKVVGHKLENDRMTLWKKDGGLISLCNWHKYDMKLESDWVISVKKSMENQSGVDIKLNT